jgi:hypothetical protein
MVHRLQSCFAGETAHRSRVATDEQRGRTVTVTLGRAGPGNLRLSVCEARGDMHNSLIFFEFQASSSTARRCRCAIVRGFEKRQGRLARTLLSGI